MKVAITGGTGIIGKCLLRQLPEGYNVIVLSRKSNHYAASNIVHAQTDYSIDSLKKIFSGCDAIIHLAAQRLQKLKADDSFKNVLLDYNVFQACKILDIKNIVFASSRGVYGSRPDIPWNEDTEPVPDNPYALGKLISEQTANYFNRKGLSITSLRIAQVLSREAKSKYVLGTFIDNARKGKPLHVYGTNKEKREYIYVKDVARGIIAALQQPEIKGVFNLGSGEVITIPELAERINRIFNNTGNIIRHEPEVTRKEYSLMDSRLFFSTFDFRIKWTIEDALIDIKNSYTN